MFEFSFTTLADKVFWAVVTALFVSIFTVIFSKRGRNFLKNFYRYIRNYDAHLDISRVDYFETDSLDSLDIGPGFYRTLKNESSISITQPDYYENRLSISVEGLPTKLDIRLEPDYRFEGDEEIIEGYRLTTSTNGELWIGYHTTDPVKIFENMSGEIANAVREHCFTASARRSHTLVRFTYGSPYGLKTGESKKCGGVKISQQNGQLRLRFSDPNYLAKGIEKCLKPFRRMLA